MKTWIMHIRSYPYFINHTELSMDNYGTVDNPAWITTVFCALMPVGIAQYQSSLSTKVYTVAPLLVSSRNT